MSTDNMREALEKAERTILAAVGTHGDPCPNGLCEFLVEARDSLDSIRAALAAQPEDPRCEHCNGAPAIGTKDECQWCSGSGHKPQSVTFTLADTVRDVLAKGGPLAEALRREFKGTPTPGEGTSNPLPCGCGAMGTPELNWDGTRMEYKNIHAVLCAFHASAHSQLAARDAEILALKARLDASAQEEPRYPAEHMAAVRESTTESWLQVIKRMDEQRVARDAEIAGLQMDLLAERFGRANVRLHWAEKQGRPNAEIATLHQRLEVAEQDTRRLDWLEQPEGWESVVAKIQERFGEYRDTFREAIDAAMPKERRDA